VNVWFALLLENHVHHETAKAWWNTDVSDAIVFSRFTQLSLLRLLTTAAAMNGKPLSMRQAWSVYDQLYQDDRVALVTEPDEFEPTLRKLSASRIASPKVWADACMLAFAERVPAKLVTFDKALSNRGADCLVLTNTPSD